MELSIGRIEICEVGLGGEGSFKREARYFWF